MYIMTRSYLIVLNPTCTVFVLTNSRACLNERFVLYHLFVLHPCTPYDLVCSLILITVLLMGITFFLIKEGFKRIY